MTNTTRRSAVMDYILREGSVDIDQLVAAFGVSRMTIHRDLDALARQGVVRKVRGGASALPSGLFESSYRYRIRSAMPEKQAIARAALAHIEPGQSVLLDDSTTAVALSEHLDSMLPLTVITNSLGVIQHLSDIDELSLLCLGGRYSRNFNSFIGLACEKAVTDLRVELLFMSASAVYGTTVYHQDEEVVKIKRAMMSVSERRFLLADHRKFDATALNRAGDLAEFHHIITTEGISAGALERLREAGLSVEVVPVTRARGASSVAS